MGRRQLHGPHGGTGKEPSVIDLVNHPSHYTSHPSGIECIEITRHMNFNLGNVIKYIWRADQKGDLLENLKKARFYLDDEIKRLEGSVGLEESLVKVRKVGEELGRLLDEDV